jgi:hypothetical protein
MQRYHAGDITAAKSADTRQRRTDKATALFRAGKQKVTTPAHQAKSDIGRPLGHERCRHRSPRSAQHRIATLAAKLPTISGGYFARWNALA